MANKLPEQSLCDSLLSIQDNGADLLEEYENCLLDGGRPNLEDYVRRFDGIDPKKFRLELQLATVLLSAEQKHLRTLN